MKYIYWLSHIKLSNVEKVAYFYFLIFQFRWPLDDLSLFYYSQRQMYIFCYQWNEPIFFRTVSKLLKGITIYRSMPQAISVQEKNRCRLWSSLGWRVPWWKFHGKKGLLTFAVPKNYSWIRLFSEVFTFYFSSWFHYNIFCERCSMHTNDRISKKLLKR